AEQRHDGPEDPPGAELPLEAVPAAVAAPAHVPSSREEVDPREERLGQGPPFLGPARRQIVPLLRVGREVVQLGAVLVHRLDELERTAAYRLQVRVEPYGLAHERPIAGRGGRAGARRRGRAGSQEGEETDALDPRGRRGPRDRGDRRQEID